MQYHMGGGRGCEGHWQRFYTVESLSEALSTRAFFFTEKKLLIDHRGRRHNLVCHALLKS